MHCHRNSGTTRFAYAGTAIIQEVNTSATVLRRYVPGPGTDEAVVWYEGSGTTSRRWLHADERGSVIAVSDGAGAMLGINRYDEYGIPQSSNLGRFQYTGQAWLPELGMYSYKARMYSPTLGRFMQTDPIGYGDGVNWYNYVGGDPVNFTDPTGLCSDDDGWSDCEIVVTANKKPKNWCEENPTRCAVSQARDQAIIDGRWLINEGPISELPCPPSSKSTMRDTLNKALNKIGSGGSVSSFSKGFSVVTNMPNFNSPGWTEVYASHADRAYQHELGDTGFAIKIYINDSHHGGFNTAAIVDSNFGGHVVDWALVKSHLSDDDSRNYNLATQFLKSSKQCRGRS